MQKAWRVAYPCVSLRSKRKYMEGRYCVLCVCPPLLMVNEADSKNHPWRSTSIMISSTNYRSVDHFISITYYGVTDLHITDVRDAKASKKSRLLSRQGIPFHLIQKYIRHPTNRVWSFQAIVLACVHPSKSETCVSICSTRTRASASKSKSNSHASIPLPFLFGDHNQTRCII